MFFALATACHFCCRRTGNFATARHGGDYRSLQCCTANMLLQELTQWSGVMQSFVSGQELQDVSHCEAAVTVTH